MSIVNLQINSSSDDGYEADDTTWVDNDYVKYGQWNSVVYDGGLRWTSVSIIKKGIIASAILSYYSTTYGIDDIKGQIKGIAEDSPAIWTQETKPSTRDKTTANINGNSANWSKAGSWYSIDIAPIIQELVNRAGWVSGNSLAIVMEDNGSSQQMHSIFSHDFNPNYAAKLDITYTIPPTEYTFSTTYEQQHGIHMIRDEE